MDWSVATTTPVISNGNPYAGTGAEAPTARDPQSYWEPSNVATDWARHEDVFAHNEAIAASERDARNAKEQRDFEEYMSNTAFQRKVADYVKAGFSPLAALEGSVGASTPSGSAASAKQAQRGSNNFGGVLGSVITAFALLASKGMSAASAAANQSAKNATAVATTLAKNETLEKVAEAKIAAAKDLTFNKSEFFKEKVNIMKKFQAGESARAAIAAAEAVEPEVTNEMVKKALDELYGRK